MTPAELDACFDQFTVSAFRLETLPSYDVGGPEAERMAAWRNGWAVPERSVRTSPWLRRIAVTTAAGKAWWRVRVLDDPLTEYERFELVSYAESLACGDETRIAVRGSWPVLDGLREDFWLFDAGTPGAFAVKLRYDLAGQFTGAGRYDDADTLLECMAARDTAAAHSVRLIDYLATEKIRLVA